MFHQESRDLGFAVSDMLPIGALAFFGWIQRFQRRVREVPTLSFSMSDIVVSKLPHDVRKIVAGGKFTHEKGIDVLPQSQNIAKRWDIMKVDFVLCGQFLSKPPSGIYLVVFLVLKSFGYLLGGLSSYVQISAFVILCLNFLGCFTDLIPWNSSPLNNHHFFRAYENPWVSLSKAENKTLISEGGTLGGDVWGNIFWRGRFFHPHHTVANQSQADLVLLGVVFTWQLEVRINGW